MSNKRARSAIHPKIFVVSGPSGSGKTTLCAHALAHPAIKGVIIKSVSVTTRAKRRAEKAGKDYRFVSEKTFLGLKQQNKLLEAEEVFGNYYGTPTHYVRSALKNKKNILLCIDVKGAMNVKRMFKNAVTIFVLPPTLTSLKTRLKGRSSEAAKHMRSRLDKARWEMGFAKYYDYIVVNDKLEHAVRQLVAIVIAEGCRQ
ncbi:guanylate kinase [Candidatus Omnitrophota bacterium]